MNIRRGLFRLWAAASLLWLRSWGIVAFGDLPAAYKAAYVGTTYEFKRADGGRLLIVARNYNEAAALSERLEHGVDAPPCSIDVDAPPSKNRVDAPLCKNGGHVCDPWDRDWNDPFINPLIVAVVDGEGKITGSVSVSNQFFFSENRSVLWQKLSFYIWFGLGPPALFGTLLLASGWIVAGFRSNETS